MKRMIALILMLISLVLIITSLITPWYTVKTESFLNETEYNFFLTKYEIKNRQGIITGPYADTEENTIIEIAIYLIIFALITCLLTIICVSLLIFNIGSNYINLRPIAILTGALTFIITISIVVYFMNEIASIFWYSYDTGLSQLNAGPGVGWYSLFLGSLSAIISTIFVFIARAERSDLVLKQPDYGTSKSEYQGAEAYPCPKCEKIISLNSKSCPFCGYRFEDF